MAHTTTWPTSIARVVHEDEEEQGLVGDDDDSDVDGAGEVVTRRVSRLAVEGGSAGGTVTAGKTASYGSDPEEQWLRVLQGGGGAAAQRAPRRSSFSVVRQERAAREAWLDRAWEMKKSWHQRNGGAPDADTPVVVVVGKGGASTSSPFHARAAGGGVAMDMEEVRACRDLGLELPSDCTVEIQCFGLSATSSPTITASGSSGAASPASAVSSPAGEDQVDVKARLKVWAQAVALASTTHLGS